MTILLIANSKGGVGKSTLATNISAFLAGTNKDVLLVDADRQITSSIWTQERARSYPNSPKVHAVLLHGEIDDALLDLSKRYEYVVVDAAGHESMEMRSALAVCDTLLMPFRPSHPDLATLPGMIFLVKTARRVNPKMKASAFINCAPTNRNDAQHARHAIADYPDIMLLETVIHDRRIFRDAMAEGLGIIEMPGKSDSDNNARTEINNLMGEILE